MRPVLWLRRRFVTGFFVAVPLIVSVAALIWAFDFIDEIGRASCRERVYHPV